MYKFLRINVHTIKICKHVPKMRLYVYMLFIGGVAVPPHLIIKAAKLALSRTQSLHADLTVALKQLEDEVRRLCVI